MNMVVREWIELHCQPWRGNPELSVSGDVTGSPLARPINRDFREYFERQGVTLEGRTYEEIIEAELLRIFEQTTSWLTADERRRVDEAVAFGVAFTQQPNAYAVTRPEGYAVLLDLAIDPVLISETELWLARSVPPITVDDPLFLRAFNVAIVSLFFRKAPFWSPIPDEGFAHRFSVNRWVWLMSVFVLSHELGHVLCGHSAARTQRQAMVATIHGLEPHSVLAPTHAAEFEADAFAIDLMMRDRENGPDGSGSEVAPFWNCAYITLTLLFTVFESTEILARRLGIALHDSHPPARQRWLALEQIIRRRMPIDQQWIDLAQTLNRLGTHAAEVGPLPNLASGAGAIFPDLDLAVQWVSADTPMRSRTLLKEHPELLGPAFEQLATKMAGGTSDRQGYAYARSRKLLPVLRRARTIGVDAAFDEWLLTGAPEAKAGSFDVPIEELNAMSAALEAQDLTRVDELRRSSKALDSLMNLRRSANLLLATKDLPGIQAVIVDHPALLHPTADKVLAEALALQQNAQAKRRVEFLRDLLNRAREIGVDRAIYECARFFSDESGVSADISARNRSGMTTRESSALDEGRKC